jgi:hypothetical protein
MEDWAYVLETYKATLHFWEIVVQSAIWPIVAVVVVIGIRWLFGKQINELMAKILTAKNISIKDVLSVDWQEGGLTKEEIKDKSELTISELASFFCNKAIKAVERLRLLIVTERANGNFLEEGYKCQNNDEFMESYFANETLRQYINIYKSIIGWKKIIEDNPEKIGNEEFKKIVTATLFFITGLSTLEEIIYQQLLNFERNKNK